MTSLFLFLAGSFPYPYAMAQIEDLVRLFYLQLWNQKNLAVADQVLDEHVHFRGSLGSAMIGRDKVIDYVHEVTSALDGYTCEILELVVETGKAAAKVKFQGKHIQQFMGYEPTGKQVEWLGTAFFESSHDQLSKIWVLGDLHGLLAILEANKS